MKKNLRMYYYATIISTSVAWFVIGYCSAKYGFWKALLIYTVYQTAVLIFLVAVKPVRKWWWEDGLELGLRIVGLG